MPSFIIEQVIALFAAKAQLPAQFPLSSHVCPESGPDPLWLIRSLTFSGIIMLCEVTTG